MVVRNPESEYFFADYADSWWDDESELKPLRSFNRCRFEYFDRFIERGWADKRVLDVGCGGGYTTEFLHSRGCRVYGLDVSERLIASARKHAEETGRGIEYTTGSSDALPYPDASFDVITCLDVLEHVQNPAQAVQEIHRVLTPGGIFLYDTINRTFRSQLIMIWLAERILGVIPKGAHVWHDFITPAEMLAYLGSSGFTPLGRPAGISVRNRNKDGSLRMSTTRTLSTIFMGAARR
ncbi:bifunctional 2-polyprenyl-6-hydroxyphenol methylase/3-demethylubiquinol 3-O-methyltransferase UbiG [Streptomyces flavofungini]|uniref:3-demethylubiquinone-9 3-O-methyltransferase n=1 Tax=Streptomyces flavofungini TaxID=68200 RepID=A0ABS0X7M9_9ACTN|nr:bifunctional 2-polyprenyl-6-hydroxyphenol methylase/3-demethylubiquinol 3-O-methyltransferase UbiG [Streptomyces flavofungini]MBJ3809213.1 3-demethylubiquinone-9 3-O-methyltransferase [Streptomyces flavofungini]GHC76938.1 ubiquinone biosynthesis O-methyltransferase [Streptomyces flavofungini]